MSESVGMPEPVAVDEPSDDYVRGHIEGMTENLMTPTEVTEQMVKLRHVIIGLMDRSEAQRELLARAGAMIAEIGVDPGFYFFPAQDEAGAMVPLKISQDVEIGDAAILATLTDRWEAVLDDVTEGVFKGNAGVILPAPEGECPVVVSASQVITAVMTSLASLLNVTPAEEA